MPDQSVNTQCYLHPIVSFPIMCQAEVKLALNQQSLQGDSLCYGMVALNTLPIFFKKNKFSNTGEMATKLH